MTEKDIKPIPNYIMKEIYKRDMKSEPWQTRMVRYYAYLTVWKKEIIKVTVAVSTIKGKQWACKQVAVHGIHSPKCYVRDMEYNYLGHGFNVGWYAEELQSRPKQFEDGKWYPADTRYYDPYAALINRDVGNLYVQVCKLFIDLQVIFRHFPWCVGGRRAYAFR